MRHPNTGHDGKISPRFRRIGLAATVESRIPGPSKELLVDAKRREVLKTGGGVLALAAAAGIIRPGEALAQEWNKTAFETKSVAETVKALGGGASTESKEIQITAPDIAENGAVVPVSVDSRLA